MPTTKLGRELGINRNPTGRYAYVDCEMCGRERLVEFRGDKPRVSLCKQCRIKRFNLSGPLSPSWRGGKHKELGYVVVWISPDDQFYPMVRKGGYVREHRLVMAKHLGRLLKPWEIVHHRNGIRDDNEIKNLELLPNGKQHLPSMQLQCQVGRLEKRTEALEQRVVLLEAENVALRAGLCVEREV